MRKSISVIIITKNEQERIEKALESSKWADEIVVVDSGSTDNTPEIVKKYTDKIYFREFVDFSSQKNFGISKCTGDWIFSLDSDEEITDGLKESLMVVLENETDFNAYRINRENKIFGKILKYTTKGDCPVRFFKKEKATFVQPIHEYLKVEGEIGNMGGVLKHNSTRTLQEEYEKTERYGELEAELILTNNIRPSLGRRFINPILIFLRMFVMKLGFLDGKEGLSFAYVSARYYFIKYLKAYNLTKSDKYLERIIAKRFSKLADGFPESIDPEDSRLNALLDSIEIFENKKILEIGCGKGRFLDSVCGKGAIGVGIDVADDLLKVAVRKNKGAYFKGTATDLHFSDSYFDSAFSIEAIEHIPDLDKCISEASRVLGMDGKFIIVDRNILSINNRRWFVPNLIIKKYHEIKNDWMYPRGFPYTEKWFFRKEVEKVLEKYFEKVTSEYVISDCEKRSPISFLFKKFPITRHFILWKASIPRKRYR